MSGGLELVEPIEISVSRVRFPTQPQLLIYKTEL